MLIIRKIAKLLGFSILALFALFFVLMILIIIFKDNNPEYEKRIANLETEILELQTLWSTHFAEHHHPDNLEVKVKTSAVDSSQEKQHKNILSETNVEKTKLQNPDQKPKAVQREKQTPAQQIKLMKWDQTPAEQEIKVGDWIAVRGYSALMLGAYYEEGSWITHNGKKYGGRLQYSNEPVSSIWIDSQARSLHSGLSRYALTDKIAFVNGGVPAARENPVARLYNELIIVESDLGRIDLRHIEFKGRVYGIFDMERKFPDGTRHTLKTIQLESKTGKLELLTPPTVVDKAKHEHEKLLSRIR